MNPADKRMIWPFVERSGKEFRSRILSFSIPVFIAVFIEFWTNIGFLNLRHSLIVFIWKHYWPFLKNQALAPLEVLPLGAFIQISTWFVQFYPWALAFNVIAVVVYANRQSEKITISRAYSEALNLAGLPTLLWRLFWRLAIAGYLTTLILGGLGVVLYEVFPTALKRPGQGFSAALGLLVFIPFFIYVYRFSLAIPRLIYEPGNAFTAMEESKQRSRFLNWRLWLLCYVVASASGLINRSLPGYIFSLSTVPFAIPCQNSN